MAEPKPVTKKRASPDWFMRGALTRIGETLDRFAGRNWQPSSSLATSQLVDRLKALLEAEKREVAGKGTVVPHNIKLKMQWDKFSADERIALDKFRDELLAAAADHINDKLYYTYAPLKLEVKPDYFTEGVKLLVSFDQFDEEASDVELNVTMPGIRVPIEADPNIATASESTPRVIARFSSNGEAFEKVLDFKDGRLTVGRIGTNGLMIDDISVSKVHASLSINNGQLSVADTGSTNGTFINGRRIAYGRAVSFEQEDRVKFGTVEVMFEVIPIPQEQPTEVSPRADSVQIGDMEFRSRMTGSDSEARVETTSAVSESQIETQKIDGETVEEENAITDKATE